jgi:hypothetical protein
MPATKPSHSLVHIYPSAPCADGYVRPFINEKLMDEAKHALGRWANFQMVTHTTDDDVQVC